MFTTHSDFYISYLNTFIVFKVLNHHDINFEVLFYYRGKIIRSKSYIHQRRFELFLDQEWDILFSWSIRFITMWFSHQKWIQNHKSSWTKGKESKKKQDTSILFLFVLFSQAQSFVPPFPLLYLLSFFPSFLFYHSLSPGLETISPTNLNKVYQILFSLWYQ